MRQNGRGQGAKMHRGSVHDRQYSGDPWRYGNTDEPMTARGQLGEKVIS